MGKKLFVKKNSCSEDIFLNGRVVSFRQLQKMVQDIKKNEDSLLNKIRRSVSEISCRLGNKAAFITSSICFLVKAISFV